MEQSLDTSQIRSWRSIITLIVFVVTNVIVLFPFHIPIYVPRSLWNAVLNSLSTLRIIPRQKNSKALDEGVQHNGKKKYWVRFRFPMNFVTAPLIADIFLLAILAIGREEVRGGTVGADNISPIDIMVFFITLAYIALSIDASGLIRYLAFKVLQKGGKAGHRLYFYLYTFFFALATFIGNDPIILSGTPFLAYMTRVSRNIVQPKAWIYMQFAVANIASAILVSSNPTNLVLAGAFKVKFISYSGNMIVPVAATAIVTFPFLLYVYFRDDSLIPRSIQMYELSDEAKAKQPVNPNIPYARGKETQDYEQSNQPKDEEGHNSTLDHADDPSLEEIMNPFLDKGGAAFGAVVMAATLITVLALNAALSGKEEIPVFWVTLPAACIMFCWDATTGWLHRHETRAIARRGREEAEASQRQRGVHGKEPVPPTSEIENPEESDEGKESSDEDKERPGEGDAIRMAVMGPQKTRLDEKGVKTAKSVAFEESVQRETEPRTLVSVYEDVHWWLQETFPTVSTVFSHLPFALVPFAFCMFVLVQALVTKGWIPVFAHGWDHWVNKTGVVGSIGGMGFLSVLLCNFAGTNIGTTILLCRVIQAWQEIHRLNGVPISDRTFWATVYSMALGVNYGAFSVAFSASLAGLLWRDILARKQILVRSLHFARTNVPIIAVTMVVGCAVLVGQVYVVRDTSPYKIG